MQVCWVGDQHDGGVHQHCGRWEPDWLPIHCVLVCFVLFVEFLLLLYLMFVGGSGMVVVWWDSYAVACWGGWVLAGVECEVKWVEAGAAASRWGFV